LDKGCGGVPTVVIVSGCYSGSFARAPMTPPTASSSPPRAPTARLSAARPIAYTDYDACLLGTLAHAATWRAVYDETKDCVSRREQQLNENPSLPQAAFGAAVRNLALQF